jgi:excisionase family DNA binding protein
VEKLAYRIPEAVEASGLGRTTLYQAIATGELEAIKVGTRRLITRDALVAFLDRHRATADDAT